jgi:hypothetical protein
MKFQARIREIGSNRSWTEEFSSPNVETEEQAKGYMAGHIRSFNASLWKGELPRELLEVTMVGPSESYPHEWGKSNLITIIEEGSRPYDTYRCFRCGATGKRYGLDPTITPDNGVSPNCKGDRK